MEDPAEIGDQHLLSGLEQLPPDRADERGQLMGGFVEDLQSDRVSIFGCLIYQLR